MKNGEINREQTFQEEQDKIKKNQANALTSQSSIEEQKQLANNVTENKANLNNNYSSSSRTNSMSEKSRVFFLNILNGFKMIIFGLNLSIHVQNVGKLIKFFFFYI